MDTETKQLLGGALIGVLLICVGLVLRLPDAHLAGVFSGIALLGGGIVALICLGRVALGLVRST